MGYRVVKIQKYMGQNSAYSRRKVEALIAEGKVKVNKKVAVIGQIVEPGDVIEIDEQIWHVKEEKKDIQVLLYHKPVGEIVTQYDEQGRPTVFSKLPKLSHGHWISVGRLDINTQGLLIFTNDGELANKLMHPSAHLLRQYKVRVFGEIQEESLAKLKKGIMLEGDRCQFTELERIGNPKGRNQWFHVGVYTGKYRMVRRLWEQVGGSVNRLIRVAFGPVVLPENLSMGAYRSLSKSDIERLKKELAS